MNQRESTRISHSVAQLFVAALWLSHLAHTFWRDVDIHTHTHPNNARTRWRGHGYRGPPADFPERELFGEINSNFLETKGIKRLKCFR